MKNSNQEVFLYENYVINSKGNMVFATAGTYNSLVEYNVEEQRLNLLSLLDGIDWGGPIRGYGRIYKYNSYMIILPRHNFKIVIYDEVEKTTEYLTIPYDIGESSTINSFWGSIQIGKDIFLLGFHLPIMVNLDCEKMSLTVIDCWEKEYKKKIKYAFPGYFRRDCIYKNNYLYLCCIQLSSVLKINLHDYTYSFIEFNNLISGISTISFDGENFWITDRQGTIIEWNEEENIENLVQIADSQRELYKYAGGLRIKDSIYFLPAVYDKLTVVSIKERKVELKNLPAELITKGKDSVRSIVEFNDQWIMIMNAVKGHMYKYYIEEDRWEMIDIIIPKDFYKFKFKDVVKKSITQVMKEEAVGIFKLENLLEFLKQPIEG